MNENSDTLRTGARLAAASETQEGLWLLDALGHGSAAHTLCRSYRVEGPMSVHALRAAWRELVDRNEALRTTLVAVDGRPVQRITAAGLDRLSFTHLDAEPSSAARGEQLAAAAAAAPFDLAIGPLVRLTSIPAGPGRHRLVLTAHEAVVDEWSMSLLVEELSMFYAAARGGGSIRNVYPSEVRYFTDLEERQRDRADEAEASGALEWWRSALSPLPTELVLPADRPRPAGISAGGRQISLAPDADLGKAVEACATAEDSSPFAVLLAAYQTLLFRYGSGERLAVGVPVATRHRGADSDIVGPGENLLVLCAEFTGEPAFRTMLAQVTRFAAGALARRDLPLARLLPALPVHRDPRRVPLCDALFVYRDDPGANLILAGSVVTPLPVSPKAVAADLTLVADTSGAGLVLSLAYRESMFDGATAEIILDRYRGLLAAAVADPGMRIDELPLGRRDELIAAAVG
jgi:(S)-beta-tyrosine adenylation enzyme